MSTTSATTPAADRAGVITVKIIPNDRGNPPGKLADAELIFGRDAAALAGLKLIGFGVWEARGAAPRRINVTFPARTYTVNSERRSFALLRPINDTTETMRLRDLIIEAWNEYAISTYPETDQAHQDAKEATTSTETTTKETDPILF